MKKISLGALCGALAVFTAYACGGVSSSSSSACIAGQSIACAGTNGCTGFQVCKSDGTYDTCNCEGDEGGSGGDSGAGGDGSTGSDAGDDSATGGDGGDFSPTDLSGLVLWLNSAGIVPKPGFPSNLVHWLDQSGNGNDVTSACTDTCPDGLPGIDPSGAHGHDAVVCSFGSTMTINDSATMRLGTGDWGMAFVYKTSGDATSIPIYAKTDGSDPNIAVAAAGSSFAVSEAGHVATSGVASVGFNYYVMRGPTMDIVSAAGTATGGTASGDVSNNGAAVSICRGSDGSIYPEIAEVIVIKGTVTDNDVAHLIGYFKKKFAL